MSRILAADIGGTNSRFAEFACRGRADNLELVDEVWIPTNQANSFSELLSLLEASKLSLKISDAEFVVLAVAGPVAEASRVSPPNIPWSVDLKDVPSESVLLINDFLAQAMACVSPLGIKEAKLVHSTTSDSRELLLRAVLGAGTGLGKALLVPDKKGFWTALPSEGGHAGFAVEEDDEFEVYKFIKAKLNTAYVSWEEFLSGRGLSHIHEALTGSCLESQEVAAQFDSASKTQTLFSRFLGRACRNYVLETLALGGVYIVGGIVSKNPGILEHPDFIKAFREAGKHSDLLSQVPVYLLNNEDSGLWGSAYYGIFVNGQ